ncbi:hypothetical protein [Chryseobacterium daeguense]|uniref:hypothetical protein n=1 Tax=Chryseobacterium daeguense TaxID=412438 RepID=UPI0003F6462C|nr:hypothetical protein [Chryseobacterium daeguense]
MKNFIKFAVLCFTLFLVSCNKEKTIDDELKEAAASMNKLTPQIMNNGIRLDSVSALPNKVLSIIIL